MAPSARFAVQAQPSVETSSGGLRVGGVAERGTLSAKVPWWIGAAHMEANEAPC